MSIEETIIKTNGKTMKAFYADEVYWGDRYYDDVIIHLNGKHQGDGLDIDKVLDTDQIEIQYGYVVDPETDETEDLIEFFRKWDKAQQSSTWLVTVPNGKEEAVRAALALLGCTVG